MDSILFLKDVHFSYQEGRQGSLKDRSDLLRGVNLNLNKGSILGIVGSNGAGKTTLLQIITGLIKPGTGVVKIAGYSPEELPDGKIGFLPERPYLHQEFRLKEYLLWLNRLFPEPVKETRIDELIELVDLKRAEDQPLKIFSKGMLHRAALAQALLGQPELLLLDEPMSGLDPGGQKRIREVILNVCKEGLSIMITSHNLYEIERISDEIAILHRGFIQMINREILQSGQEYHLKLNYSGDIRERLLTGLEGEGSVLNGIKITDNRLSFPVDSELYFKMISLLNRCRIEICQLKIAGPSLEEVVLNYLGKGENDREANS